MVVNRYCSFLTVSVISLQTGQLNEYTERKEMSTSVICMALGRVPAGEQRSRFLAVGLADNTIRIISLQPQVCRHLSIYLHVCLQCFDAVGWAAGRASGL